MRVIYLSMLAVMPLLAGPGGASAQSILYRPAAPSAGVSGLLDVRYQRIEGLGETALNAGQLGLEVEGRLLPDRLLEIGARWGLRGSTIVLEGFGARTRVGLPPLTVFVGTGARVDQTALGLRLLTGASFALLGVDDGSSNGEHAFAALEGALFVLWPDLSIDARLSIGVAYAGSTALSGIVRIDARADIGSETWSVRPLVGATAAYATDMFFGGELLFGATALVERAPLRFGVGLTPWQDPSGNIVRIWLAANAPL